MTRTTFQDSVAHLVDYLGGNPSQQVVRDAKRSVLEAYRDLANAQRWAYLVRHGRLHTVEPFCPLGATVTYDLPTNALTLVSGFTWPAWAAAGYIRVGVVAYRVKARVSDSVLTLDDEVGPGDTFTDPRVFKLYEDTYLLPADYIGNDQTMYENNFSDMAFVRPSEWLFANRYVFSEGTPRSYTITGDPQYPGRLVMRVFPFPDAARTIDFVYIRRPRPLQVHIQPAAVTTAAASAVVIGLNTAWTPSMVGAVLRVSANQQAPTSTIGENPAAFEGTVLSVGSATSLTLDTPAPATYTNVPAVVSDPLDLEDGAMLNAFFRCSEMHVSYGRTLKDKPSARPLYQAALVEAKQADSRSYSGRAVGQETRFRQRLRDMPLGPDDVVIN